MALGGGAISSSSDSDFRVWEVRTGQHLPLLLRRACECAEENLARVLSSRAITADETNVMIGTPPGCPRVSSQRGFCAWPRQADEKHPRQRRQIERCRAMHFTALGIRLIVAARRTPTTRLNGRLDSPRRRERCQRRGILGRSASRWSNRLRRIRPHRKRLGKRTRRCRRGCQSLSSISHATVCFQTRQADAQLPRSKLGCKANPFRYIRARYTPRVRSVRAQYVRSPIPPDPQHEELIPKTSTARQQATRSEGHKSTLFQLSL